MPGTTFDATGRAKTKGGTPVVRRPQRTVELTAGSVAAFAGLDGDLAKAFIIRVSGRLITSGGVERYPYVRINGTQTGAGQNLLQGVYAGSNSSGETNYTQRIHYNAGVLTLGRSYVGVDQAWTAEAMLQAIPTSSQRSMHTVFSCHRADQVDFHNMGGTIHGWIERSDKITQLEVVFDGGTFTGTVTLESITNDGLGLGPLVATADFANIEAWTPITGFVSPWVANATVASYGIPSHRRTPDGKVHLKGALTGTGSSSGSTIATLPYTLPHHRGFIVSGYGNGTYQDTHLDITPTGALRYHGGHNIFVYLDDISFFTD